MKSTQIIGHFAESAKQKLIEKAEQKKRADFQGLLFVGNRHESVPLRLLTDSYLTPRAKLAWQLIKLNAYQFQGAAFPSYDELSLWLSERAFEGKRVSRKVISQTLLLLRLTRWLTLCETVRNERGQILGNVYVMNDEPLSVVDCLQLNDDYFCLLEKSVKHKDPLIKDVAIRIIDDMLNQDAQLWLLVSHIEAIQARYQAHKQGFHIGSPITPLAKNMDEAIKETQQRLLSSNKELGKIDRELSEKRSILLSSNTELSHQDEDKSLILGLVPNGNSESTSTVLNTKKSTVLYDSLNCLNLGKLETETVYRALNKLDKETAQAILVEAEQRIHRGNIQNPLGYILGIIRRAQSGEFKPYWQNKQNQQSNQTKLCDTGLVSSRRLLEANTQTNTDMAHTKAVVANLAQQLRANLRG